MLLLSEVRRDKRGCEGDGGFVSCYCRLILWEAMRLPFVDSATSSIRIDIPAGCTISLFYILHLYYRSNSKKSKSDDSSLRHLPL